MRPGADGKVWTLAVLAKRAIVAQLQGQKDIVPPGHHLDRYRNILDRLIKTTPFPVRISWLVMFQPFLKKRRMRTCGKLVEIAQRQVREQRFQSATSWKEERREQVHALLTHDQIGPGGRGNQTTGPPDRALAATRR